MYALHHTQSALVGTVPLKSRSPLSYLKNKKKKERKVAYAPDHRSNRRTMTKPVVAVLYFTPNGMDLFVLAH